MNTSLNQIIILKFLTPVLAFNEGDIVGKMWGKCENSVVRNFRHPAVD
jgi:hypothetical protein